MNMRQDVNTQTVPLKTIAFKQHGLALWHVLLMVVIAVGAAVYVNANGIGFVTRFVPDSMNMPSLSNPFNSNQSGNRRTETQYSDTNTSRTENYSSDYSTTYSGNPTNNSYDFYTKPPADTRTSAATRATAYSYLADEYDLIYPPNIEDGYYTVQVFSGYNSRQAFALQRELRRDGYRSFVDEKKNQSGILFRVRIGRYHNRSDAFAVRDKVRERYPRTLQDSFVMQVQRAS